VRRRREPLPETLAAAVADGASVDWAAIETQAVGVTNADLVRQLRVIAAMRVRNGATRDLSTPWLRHAVVGTFGVGVTLAAAKVLVAIAGAIIAFAAAAVPPAAWPFALNLMVFGVGGLLMVVGGGNDRRLQLLGGVYLTIASAFVGPFQATARTVVGVLVDGLALCAPESFFALGMWLFAWAFPAEPLQRRTRLVAVGSIVVAAVVGSVLFGTSFVVEAHHAWAFDGARLPGIFHAFDRQAPQSMYWPLCFGLALPAVPFLVAKSRTESPERRRKVARFLAALAFGLLPILVAAIATPFISALRTADYRQSLGVVVYLGLASIVPMTAYAVAVNHVMDWQFVIRMALRYALARYAIRAAILAPLSYLAIDVFLHRGLTILQYLELQRPTGLLAFSGLGLVALTFRPHLVRAVDRWFLREPLDAAEALARLEHRFRAGEHLREISTVLADELTRALHADRVAVMLLADDGASLVSLDGRVPSIPHNSVLVEILRSSRNDIRVEVGSAIARLLPEPDRDWLDDTAARLLSPLVGSSGDLLGFVAIASGPDELPYTERHTALVTAMCSRAALQLENRWLRQTQADPARGPATVGSGVAWQDEPAVWCPNCTQTWSPDTRRCRCGTATRPAALPLFVNAKFRLQRVLGAGGTGVVYLATDLTLDRKVALKTLPPVRREFAARLRREARAMAAVRHPNLATIYGAEEWHETPLLVVEYLEGGTLLDALAEAPLSPDETIDLGITLADALDRVHGSGVLHRDIKPSNIGFTADGTPKLLDFGLAAMLDSSKGPGSTVPTMPVDAAELAGRFRDLSASSTLTITQQVVGTPLYLAPEALAGSPPRESFDLWSLNLVLYEAVAGRHPLGGRAVPDVVDAIQHETLPDVRDFRPECPAPLAAFLADALSRVASRRPVSASALRTRLRGLRARLDQAS
jgi:Protein kinase domain/GAF domain